MSVKSELSNFDLMSIYGENCFSDSVMRERLPKNVYKSIKAVQRGEAELTLEVAEVIAGSMKDWAIEKGATHYTHWFQPLTGLTAEKHDSFIAPAGDGTVLLEFSGKELIKGEPDASSFPNGGLRATFEARGYTAWDTTSPAFLKEDNTGITLCIPTAFISYTGEALDKKVPLLRSMEAVDKSALRILKILGNTTSKQVIASVGPEQEYFLVDKEYFDSRPDLLLSGRTVFGAMPSKGQEMDDHYFGAIKERVADFMKELNFELWRLGISAKTQHNEVAPNQFELATIYTTANLATDSNQIVMEMMKKIAARHGLVALLHEKPFAGVNGSGKHNNWSIGTDDGINLLEPGKDPKDNAQFLLFLSAVIKAVDEYAPILRASASNSGNDHRLGANEAPPAIISIFLGTQLDEIVKNIATGSKKITDGGDKMELGVMTLPDLPKDATDRNRTSPFAFTGNKFEFRMVASSQSIAAPNVVLNTVVAEILDQYSERLEKASDINAEIKKIVTETYENNWKVVFNGNGYSQEWVEEAAKRGLPNIPATIYALPEYVKDYSVNLFMKHKVFTKEELESRVAIYQEEYSKQINIEASVMVSMADTRILPAANGYFQEMAGTVMSAKELGLEATAQMELAKALLENINGLKAESDVLKTLLAEALELEEDLEKQAAFYREKVFVQMAKLRVFGDTLETLVDSEIWPFPTYEELLFKL